MTHTSMSDLMSMVERFNRQVIGLKIPDKPTLLSYERSEFRLRHMREEVFEIADAQYLNNMEDVVDGCLDLAYVALGTLVEMGVVVGATFEEVHAANMRREHGINARRDGHGFDAVKPEGWEPPDLAPYLTLTRSDIVWLLEQREVTEAYAGKHGLEYVEPHVMYPTGYAAITKGLMSPGEIVKPRLLVIGHAKHGKDTICEYLRDVYGFKFTSSSWFLAERIMIPYFAEREGQGGPRYQTVEECFEDRINHRGVWYEAIRDFNRPDATALAHMILEHNDVYCGMRSHEELHACRNAGVFDHVIWVDASKRVEAEPYASCSVEPWMADFVVDANGTVEESHFNIDQLMGNILS